MEMTSDIDNSFLVRITKETRHNQLYAYERLHQEVVERITEAATAGNSLVTVLVSPTNPGLERILEWLASEGFPAEYAKANQLLIIDWTTKLGEPQ